MKKTWNKLIIVSFIVLAVVACAAIVFLYPCLLYTSPSPRDVEESRMPSSA